MMYIEHRDFRLPGKKNYLAHCVIHPARGINISVDNAHPVLAAPLNKLAFKHRKKTSELACFEDINKVNINWQLTLSIGDAKELQKLLQELEAEFEQLMADL